MSPASPEAATGAGRRTRHGAPALVIFDCDGVLVDSEPISVAVLARMIADAGGAITEGDIYRRFLGRSMASVCAELEAEHGIKIGPAELARMSEALFENFRRDLRPMRGIKAALAALPCARCVASSGEPHRIRTALGITGLLELLEPHIYSASMVQRGKPAPDLFLHAAGAMGVAPQHCVVIEDSPAGIEAAQRAGMGVLAFTGGSHIAHAGLAGALSAMRPDAIFDDMRRLPALLSQAGRSGA